MLQNIVFQDNLYQLTRTADLLKEGLMLDLSSDYFFDKTIDDLLFLDASIQKIARHILANPRISGHVTILHMLRSCQERYIDVLALIITRKSAMEENFLPLFPKIQSIKNNHLTLAKEISTTIQKGDRNLDSRDVVSQNELSELLNF